MYTDEPKGKLIYLNHDLDGYRWEIRQRCFGLWHVLHMMRQVNGVWKTVVKSTFATHEEAVATIHFVSKTINGLTDLVP